jgi:hypothetical protein
MPLDRGAGVPEGIRELCDIEQGCRPVGQQLDEPRQVIAILDLADVMNVPLDDRAEITPTGCGSRHSWVSTCSSRRLPTSALWN